MYSCVVLQTVCSHTICIASLHSLQSRLALQKIFYTPKILSLTTGGVVSFADPSVLRTFYCLSIFDRLRLPRFRQPAKMTAAIRNIRQRYHHRLSSRVVPQHNAC